MLRFKKIIYKTFCAVRISIGIILLASLLVGGADASKVSPVLECVADMGDGSYISYWGYNNQNSGTVTIAIGTNNNFNPLPQNRGQPTSFLAGRSPYYPNAAFSVPFDGSNLVWYLKYGTSSAGTATASSNPANRCKPIITITSPTATTYATTSIPLIVSANEAISTWNYSLNGGVNITFTSGTTITAAEGPNTLIVYAYAANGNPSSWNSSSVAFTVSPPTKSDQTITFGALSDKTFGDADFDVSASASSGLPVSFTASGTCTITGSTVSISGAGTCTVIANQSGNATYNPAPDVSQIFTINQASSTTTVTCPANDIYTGSALTPCSVTVTGAGGLSLTPAPVYSNNVDAGTASASYTYAGDANHAGSSDSITFTIDPASSTTTVTCTVSETYTGSAITPCSVSVTGAGGLSLTPAPVYSNNVNAGTASASYSYAGDANHAISSDSKTFVINKATTTITLSGLSHTYDGTQKSATATTNPIGLTVVSITYDGSSTAPTTIGSYAVVANLTNDNYAAVPATGTLEISPVPKIGQTITFGALSSKTYGEADFGVSATASSGLPVSFSIVSGSATVLGSTITITGVGTVTVRASQAGNDTYNAAPNVDQAFTVNQATPIITWSNPADITYGTALGATQLNAVASVPGGFLYTPAAGTVLSAGAGQILHAAFTPTDTTNYTVASKDVMINVTGTLPIERYINGTVMDSLTHEVLAGVTVSTTGGISSLTDGSGKYSLTVVSGSYPLTATYDIRYNTNSSVTVSTVLVEVVVQDIELELKPTGTISGSVKIG